MKVRMICIGKIKEAFFKDAISEYSKRIRGYLDLEIIEYPDFAAPSGANEDEIKDREWEKPLSKIQNRDYVVALDLNKKELDSVSFSKALDEYLVKGGSEVTFLIGGSLGLSDKAKSRANDAISFGKMTFPHNLARVMLLEQIYRALRIKNNEPYHK